MRPSLNLCFSDNPTARTVILIMPAALEKAGKEGVRLLCADGQDRHCFPLLAVFMADYEEQVTLIGIKSSRKYSIYYIYTNKRHDLTTAI